MEETYDVTGMSCAACSARVQKCVSALPGVEACSVNLLKNSMVVTYDDKALSAGQIVAAVEKAGYGAAPRQKGGGKGAAQAVSPVSAAKKEYEAMRRRVIWSFVFTVPLFYLSMGHMMGWPLPAVFLGTEHAMVYALTLFLLVLPVAAINNKYYRNGFRSLLHRAPNMDSLIALGSGASLAYGDLRPLQDRLGPGPRGSGHGGPVLPRPVLRGGGHHPDPHHPGQVLSRPGPRAAPPTPSTSCWTWPPRRPRCSETARRPSSPPKRWRRATSSSSRPANPSRWTGWCWRAAARWTRAPSPASPSPWTSAAGDKVIGATINQSG